MANDESDQPTDLNDVLMGFTMYVQNERVRSYNEGLDAGVAMERERCAKIADNETDPADYSGAAKVIGTYIRSGGTPGDSSLPKERT